MDKRQLIKRLLPVVAHESHWDRLEDYFVYQRAELVETLITCQDIKSINRLQGEIIAIDKLLSLPKSIKAM